MIAKRQAGDRRESCKTKAEEEEDKQRGRDPRLRRRERKRENKRENDRDRKRDGKDDHRRDRM